MAHAKKNAGQVSAKEQYWWCSVLVYSLAIAVNKKTVSPERLRVGRLRGGGEGIFGALADIHNAAGEVVARMPVVFADTKGVELFKKWLEVRKSGSGLEAKDDQRERAAIIKYLEGLLDGTMAGVMNIPDFGDADYLRQKERNPRARAPKKLSVIVLDAVDGVHYDSDDEDDDRSGPKARVIRYERLNADKIFGGGAKVNISQVRDGGNRGGMYMVDTNNPPYIELFAFVEPGANVETEFHGRRIKGGNEMVTIYVGINDKGDISSSFDTYVCDKAAQGDSGGSSKPAKKPESLTHSPFAGLEKTIAPPPPAKAVAVPAPPKPKPKDEVPVDVGGLEGPPGSQGKDGDKKVVNG